MLTLLPLVFMAVPQEPTAPSFMPAHIGPGGAVVRSFHHDDMPILVELEAGTPVRVVATREPWARIQAPGGFAVWVWADYVDAEGQDGVLNARHVRARPLPSTGADAYPVGQFLEGDRVTILQEQDGWFEVRAPENLGAWVRSRELNNLEEVPADWNTQWATLVGPPEEDVVEVETSLATPTIATDVEGGVAMEEASIVLITDPVLPFEEAWIPEPGVATLTTLEQAEAGLDSLALVWNAELAGKVEAQLGSILWMSDQPELVARAQAGMGRLVECIDLAAGGSAAEAGASLTGSALTTAEDVDAPYSLVGTVIHTPKIYSAIPYTISVGEQTTSVMSRDGRFDLRDYVGREVAAHGVWRKSSKPGHRVLEVTKLRVLPPADEDAAGSEG